MRTIKIRLFLTFLSIFIIFVAMGIIFDAAFLERYYVHMNEGIFRKAYVQVTTSGFSEDEQLFELLRSIDRKEGISSIISGSNYLMKFSSFPQKSEQGSQRLPSELELLIEENKDELLKGSLYSITSKPDTQDRQIVLVSTMPDGSYLFLRKSMKGISESAGIAIKFHLIIGSVLLVVGGVSVYSFSKRLTDPIIDLSRTAERISLLDFSGRVDERSNDEIGMLGRSMNMISDKLSLSISELQKDVDRRKQLVRDISHELKTPIGIIKGYAEGLKYNVAEDSTKAEKYCSIIASECDRMDNLVKDLLNLSILEAGTANLSFSDFSSSALMDAVAERFQEVMQEKGISFRVEETQQAVIHCDYMLMNRALSNFVTNAIEHVQADMIIILKGELRAGRFRFSIFNTGEQIPNEEKARLWDVLYTADKSRTRREGSHGIGLSICRQIALMHNGEVGQLNVDGGVVFFIEVPAAS